jgi:hypothetical protein
MVLRRPGTQAVTGRGVLVAMVDTGFYKHPFYAWHGYHYNAALAPDATNVDQTPTDTAPPKPRTSSPVHRTSISSA